MKEMIAYYRVSTNKQGVDGYGMGAQKEMVARYVASQQGNLIAEFAEVETGKNNERVEMAKALAMVKARRATLVIAKLDRLSRNAAFLLTLQNSGCDFVCCDVPNACPLTIGILALISQNEARMISERTKAGMAIAKARGVKIGCTNPSVAVPKMNAGARAAKSSFAAKMASIVAEIRSSGVDTLQGIADCLNRRGYATRTGKQWFPMTVKNLIAAIPA